MSYSTRIREDTGAVNVPEDMMSYSTRILEQ
jgi:hypothetical protein